MIGAMILVSADGHYRTRGAEDLALWGGLLIPFILLLLFSKVNKDAKLLYIAQQIKNKIRGCNQSWASQLSYMPFRILLYSWFTTLNL
jgi:hypothetical protein